MLINLRNAMMAGKRLPYDAEVEYLESTGTQWIDTGYVPTSTSGAQVVGEFISLPTSDYSGFFGCKTTGVSDRFWAVSSNQNNGTFVGFGNNYTMASASLNTIYTTQVNYKNSRTATFTSTTNVSGFNNGGTKPVFLFAVNIGALAYYQGSMRIYSAQLTESSEIVRDFIPVRKGTVGYLYDRVTGKLFGNAGTGDFVLGLDVVPVEYIGVASGYPYIDTLWKPTAPFIVQSNISPGVSSGNFYLIGSRDDSTNNANGIGLGAYNGGYRVHTSNRGSMAINPSVYTTCPFDTTSFGEVSFGVSADEIFCSTSSTVRVPISADRGTAMWANGPGNLLIFRYTSDSVGNFDQNLRVGNIEIIDNSNPVRKFRPVRVGTEGAMMDVLTRRIYRNAGTGAFGYGNDLKYPIPAE